MILTGEFFHRDVLEVAPDLVGKRLVRVAPDGREHSLIISETEAYRGEEDTACHAHRGRTPRCEVMYREAGTLYVYLTYGIHHLLNIVTAEVEAPQAVLIRAAVEAPGPGRLTKALGIDLSFNRQHLDREPRLRLEDDGSRYEILTDRRVGIDYSAPADRDRLWRFKMGKRL